MERRRVQIEFNEPSLTKQAFKDECDINRTMSRFKKTCGADFLNCYNRAFLDDGKHFGDFSNITDYRSALEQVAQARDVFMQLPAQVRARFDNDPAKMLDFCSDPRNQDELVALGLADAKAEAKVDEKPA